MELIGRSALISSLALIIVGCGSSSPSETHSASSSPPRTQAFFKFSDCMRQHGVTNFPDPEVTGDTIIIRRPASAVGPAFQAAHKACDGILPAPQQAQATKDLAHKQDVLAFARCMRSHGVTNFPDPTSDGQLTVEMLTSAGIDVHAPTVLSAVRICLPAANGAITPADVRHALSEQG